MDPVEYDRLKEYIRIESFCDDTAGLATAGVFRQGENSLPRESIRNSDGIEFDLNQADSLQLLSVYGIGPVFARRILRYRESLGGFYSPSQLLEVYGFTPSQYQSLSQCSYIDTGFLRKIDLNLVEARDLRLHPYLDNYQAESIIFCRQQLGRYEDPQELLENRLLPDSVFRRVRPYLSAGR